MCDRSVYQRCYMLAVMMLENRVMRTELVRDNQILRPSSNSLGSS